MPDSSPDNARGGAPVEHAERGTRAGQRGKGVAIGLFIAFAVVFVGSSASQIVRAIFSRDVLPLRSGEPGSSASACTGGLASLLSALDRAEGVGKSASASAVDESEAVNVFQQGLRPEWDERGAVEKACAASPEGLESWAALLRLREAIEQWIRRESVALSPLRRDVVAHLPANLR